MPRLMIIQGPGAGRVIEPSAAGIVVGRQPGLDLTLDSAAVSRRHARITWEGEQGFIEDLGSSNGTYINGSRAPGRTPLHPGDMIRIGPAVLKLEAEADPEVTLQAVAATSNTDLFRENAGRKLHAVLDLARHLGRTLEPERLHARLLEELLGLFPHADRAVLFLGEEDPPAVRVVLEREGHPPGIPAPGLFSRSVVRRVYQQGVALLAGDTRDEHSFLTTATVTRLGIRSLVCVPLKGRAGRVFGALELDRFGAGEGFAQEDLFLMTSVALLASTVLENAQLHLEVVDKERLERDLATARGIQLGYLPREAVRLSGGRVDLHAELEPALEVSGDFYDYFPLDEDRMAFCVADVSGKGIPAALFMTQVRGLGRHLASQSAGPAELLDRLNDAVARDNPNMMFVTVAAGTYDARTGGVVLARGGHPPALLRRRDGRTEEVAHRAAPLLGMQAGIRRSDEATLLLEPGDTLILYTDGVTESPAAGNPHQLFGTGRLLDAVRALPEGGPLEEWARRLRTTVAAFSGDGPLADDITLLFLRHAGNPG